MDTRIITDVITEPVNQDELKNYIKFEDTNAEEELLISSMITAVRVHFERRTGLSFAQKTFETLFRYNDKPYLLPRSPVISIDKVETVDYLGVKTALVLNSGYYKRGLYEIEIIPTITTGDDLLVTYKAGYDHANTENLPVDLLEAMKMQIKQWYDNRDDFYEFNILGSIDKILNKHKTKVL